MNFRKENKCGWALMAVASALFGVSGQGVGWGASAVSSWSYTEEGKGSPGAEPRVQGPADVFFSGDRVVAIEIEIPRAGIAKLDRYQWRWGSAPRRRPNVRAVVRAGGGEWTDVAVHLKGSMGSFRSVHEKPALTLDFDRFVKRQSFFGLGKIHLNNSVQDPTYCNEKISRELYLAAGIPVPRATHATVKLNGRNLGLYVLVEGSDKRWLREHFKDISGNLYDGGFLQDIDGLLKVNSGEAPYDRSDLRRLVSATREGNLARRYARLKEILNVDLFLSHLALDIMTWNWDGYALKRNNYRLFDDRSTGKFIFIPHGMDQMFGQSDAPITATLFDGLVARSLMEVREARRLFFHRMKELHGTVLSCPDLIRRVREISDVLQPVLAAEDVEAAREQAEAAEGLEERIHQRHVLLDYLLNPGDQVLQFGPDNSAELTGWKGRTYAGRMVLKLSTTRTGNRIASLRTNGSNLNIGRWYTEVWLGQGDYRLVGRVRYHAGQGGADLDHPRSGVSLRASANGQVNWIRSGRGWVESAFDFSVIRPLRKVEIVCELRALSGEGSFDLDSMRLIKRP